jgi:DNA-binding HxlR family transcriptional regulator
LKQLERDGFVQREVFPVIPPRVEYRLTGLGQSFRGLTDRIAEWTAMHSLPLPASLPQRGLQSVPLTS